LGDEPAGPTKANIAYRAEDEDAYARERCQLDLYLPTEKRDFPTLVWFHGGGLEGGDKGSAKALGKSLAEAGVALASANYRLSPKASYPAFVEDAAAAAAWTMQHIAAHGGDPKRVFVSGHSAGGYLTLMLALDARYLEKHSLKPEAFAGFVPVSGQTVTHAAIRKAQGIGRHQIVVDAAAPLRHVRADAPPLLLLAAEHDMAGRAEENQLLYANLKAAGCKRVKLQIVADRDHGSIGSRLSNPDDAARALLLEFMGIGR
jgi:acetyl esterase/lipase